MADRFVKMSHEVFNICIGIDDGKKSWNDLIAYLRAEFGKEHETRPSLCLSCENKIDCALEKSGTMISCTGYRLGSKGEQAE